MCVDDRDWVYKGGLFIVAAFIFYILQRWKITNLFQKHVLIVVKQRLQDDKTKTGVL